MLTIIYTWTCAMCGNVRSKKYDGYSPGMHVAVIPPPDGWSWMNDQFLICDKHRIVVQDIEPQQEQQA